jgi:hypothetical protein|tara:strand:+ start:541 stop:1209 length:669 start_codon:yes stop_codon:yes gene_type:complete
MPNLINEAFTALFPDKDIEDYNFNIKYHNKFNPYNANVKYSKNNFQFNLSKKWRRVSKEIQIGLIQELLLKIFKEKKKTTNIDLYNIFLKNVHISIPKDKSDPVLEESFNRINDKHFFGQIEQPNLVWGTNSLRKLGHYEYGSDTISMSTIFRKLDQELLDYVMYHEMLHKKHKFNNKNGRNHHHTKEFRDNERAFNEKDMEKELARALRKLNTRRIFGLEF